LCVGAAFGVHHVTSKTRQIENPYLAFFMSFFLWLPFLFYGMLMGKPGTGTRPAD